MIFGTDGGSIIMVAGIIVTFLLPFIMDSVILWLAGKLFNSRKKGFWRAVNISFLSASIQTVPFLWIAFSLKEDIVFVWWLVLFAPIWFVIDLLLVKAVFRSPWGNTALITIAWWGAGIAVRMLLFVVFSLLLPLIGLLLFL